MLPLKLPRASRIRVGAILVLGLLILLGFISLGAGAMWAAAFSRPGPGQSGHVATLLLGLGLWAMAVLPYLLVHAYLRTFREKHPHVVLSSDGMTVMDSAVFVGPQLIRGQAIRRMVLGPGVTKTFSSLPPFRKDPPVVLGAYAEPPNALFMFDRPTVLDRAYVPFPTYRTWIGRPPDSKRPVEQAWVAFDDAKMAYEVLRRWGPAQWHEDALGAAVWIRPDQRTV